MVDKPHAHVHDIKLNPESEAGTASSSKDTSESDKRRHCQKFDTVDDASTDAGSNSGGEDLESIDSESDALNETDISVQPDSESGLIRPKSVTPPNLPSISPTQPDFPRCTYEPQGNEFHISRYIQTKLDYLKFIPAVAVYGQDRNLFIFPMGAVHSPHSSKEIGVMENEKIFSL